MGPRRSVWVRVSLRVRGRKLRVGLRGPASVSASVSASVRGRVSAWDCVGPRGSPWVRVGVRSVSASVPGAVRFQGDNKLYLFIFIYYILIYFSLFFIIIHYFSLFIIIFM